ncbi:hypothetical protein LINGRAHAP2_LOCUS6884 [Linum grandiflorum]
MAYCHKHDFVSPRNPFWCHYYTMGYISRKLLPFAAAFWVSICTLFLALFRFITGTPNFRVENGVSIAKGSNLIEPEIPETEKEMVSPDVSEYEALEEEEEEEKHHNSEDEKPKFVFKFEYQTFREDDIEHDLPYSSSSKKYEFLLGEDMCHSVEEPAAVPLTVKECFTDSGEGFADRVSGDVIKSVQEEVAHVERLEEMSTEVSSKEEEEEKENEAEFVVQEPSIVKGKEPVDDVLPSEEFMASDYDESESMVLSRSTSDGLLSDYDSEEEGLSNFVNSLNSAYGSDDFEDEDSSTNSNTIEELQKEVGSEEVNDTKNSEDGYVHSKYGAWDSEDGNNGLEVLWEHQDLIEQMKMELKKVKATGLPTILEDDECPKISIEDLKPWKIEEKFDHEDKMSELHRFYKSYRDRMRKFDILNYQKTYATSFLQSKDPLESMSSSTQKRIAECFGNSLCGSNVPLLGNPSLAVQESTRALRV